MNELGRLLAFMTEEDRLQALTLYGKMFDDSADEGALIQALQSPTRQAVILSRSYDASRRYDEEEHPDDGSTPDFILAILDVYEQAVPLDGEAAPAVPAEPEPAPVVTPPPIAADGVPAEPAEEPVPAEEPRQDPIEDEMARVRAGLSDIGSVFGDGDASDGAGADPAVSDDLPAAAEEPLPAEPLILPDAEPKISAPRPAREADPAPAWTLSDELPGPDEDAARGPRVKVFALILFILFAIPVTLLGIALLLIPTLVSLVLSLAAFAACFFGIYSLFRGFAIFADMLIIIGCSLVLFALGVLFFWLFIWFIGGAIVGLIRSVIHTGRSWCYKEVSE